MTRWAIGVALAVALLVAGYLVGVRHDEASDIQRRLDAQQQADEIRKAIEDADDSNLADRLSGGGLY